VSPGWITHLDLGWDVAPLARFYRRLAEIPEEYGTLDQIWAALRTGNARRTSGRRFGSSPPLQPGSCHASRQAPLGRPSDPSNRFNESLEVGRSHLDGLFRVGADRPLGEEDVREDLEDLLLLLLVERLEVGTDRRERQLEIPRVPRVRAMVRRLARGVRRDPAERSGEKRLRYEAGRIATDVRRDDDGDT
jgi:hypothetical protein